MGPIRSRVCSRHVISWQRAYSNGSQIWAIGPSTACRRSDQRQLRTSRIILRPSPACVRACSQRIKIDRNFGFDLCSKLKKAETPATTSLASPTSSSFRGVCAYESPTYSNSSPARRRALARKRGATNNFDAFEIINSLAIGHKADGRVFHFRIEENISFHSTPELLRVWPVNEFCAN